MNRTTCLFLLALAVSAGAQTDEDFFEDVTEAPIATPTDHQAALLEQDQWRFGGVMRTSLQPIWSWKKFEDFGQWPDDSIRFSLSTDLYLDARPDRSNRVFAKVRLEWPFDSGDRVKLFELFTDFRLGDYLSFRFGKQVATWGYSRFYQIADVFSLQPKDPTNPTLELEGPVALKAVWLPNDFLQIEGLSFAKPSFLPAGSLPRAENLGYALRLRSLLAWGGEITLGGFFQKDLAPRLIAGFTSALPGFNLQIFGDGVISRGSDQRFLVGEWPLMSSEKRTEEWMAQATVGLMYRHSDWRMLMYLEYLVNSSGALRSDYLADLFLLYSMEQMLPADQRTLTLDDLRYRYRHNLSGFVQWTDVFEVKRLGVTVLSQLNPIEPSAYGEGSVGWGPSDQVILEAGTRLAWGKDDSEFVLRQQGLRLGFFVRAKLGVSSF